MHSPLCGLLLWLAAAHGLKMELQLPSGVPVADQIVITFCDCSSSGPRMVHALQASSSGAVTRHPFQVSGAESQIPTLSDPSDPTTARPFLLVNVSPSQGSQPQVSIICINTYTSEGPATHLAAALVACLQSQRQAGGPYPPVVVAAAAVLNGIKTKTKGAYVLPINGAQVPPILAAAAPPLPPTTRLHDSFLATLTHCLYVTGLQALCLLVPGHKPSISGGLADSVDEVAALAGAVAVAGLLPGGVSCDPQRVKGLQLLHRWYADAEGGDHMMYM